MLNRLSKLLTRFSTNTHGGLALMGGFMITVVATSVVAAVDITDMTVTKQKMQDRVDSAVLFATLQDKYNDPKLAGELQDVARKFIIDSIRTTGVRAEDVVTNFVYDENRDRIVGEVHFTPPAIFAGSLFAPWGMEVKAEAAPQQPSKMELALVLDVSGSMNWSIASDIEAPVGSRRIDALRDGVDTLIEGLKEAPRLEAKISVVPYATSVDVANLLAGADGNANSWFVAADGDDLPEVCKRKTNNGNVKGKGNAFGHLKDCAESDDDDDNNSSNASVTDPSPIGAWGAERYVAKNGSSFSLNLASPAGNQRVPVITQPERTTYCDDSYVDSYGSRCVEFVTIGDSTYAEQGFFAPRSGILPLTDKLEEVTGFMSTLQAEGGTAGHLGAAWGLYSLTDEWDPIFDHPAGEPARFRSETQKAMIIMTDGDFTMTHDENMTVSETYDYFQAVCSLARSKGVQVYTVGLRASTLTDTELTKCAGSAERYFQADSRAQLINAFEEIAKKASRVRLSG